MKNCEDYEVLISSWLDDEAPGAQQVEWVDHLVRCAGCRDFYRQARSLEGVLAAVRTPARAEALPSDLWRRIADAGRVESRRVSPARRLPTWALRAAAVLVVAVGLPFALRQGWSGRDPAVPPVPRTLEVRLGENPESMDDARFVGVATELLRADRRYHAAMYRLMDQVVRDSAAAEMPIDEGPRRLEGLEVEESGAHRERPT